MKEQKHAAWLLTQLPDWVKEGLLSAESAEKLQQRYAFAQPQSGKRWAIILFGILGAALIGGGIILLLAHNWDELTRAARTVIAFLPLLLGQALTGWILLKRKDSVAWREGVGTWTTLAIGTCIALISQTYNLGGDFGDFMLAWVLLALPLAYLLGATLTALLYLVGITIWAGAVSDNGFRALGYFPLLALAIPYLGWVARGNRHHPRAVLFCWMLALTLPFGLGLAINKAARYETGTWLMMYIALSALVLLAGRFWFGGDVAWWQQPFRIAGRLGILGLSVAMSFRSTWEEVLSDGWAVRLIQFGSWSMIACFAIYFAIPLAALLLLVTRWRERDTEGLLWGAAPVVAYVAMGLVFLNQMEVWGMVVFNLYLAVMGIAVLVAGLRAEKLALVNGGMLILAIVILARFFDADIEFVARGIGFIVVGIGFLVTNIILLRRKKEAV